MQGATYKEHAAGSLKGAAACKERAAGSHLNLEHLYGTSQYVFPAHTGQSGSAEMSALTLLNICKRSDSTVIW